MTPYRPVEIEIITFSNFLFKNDQINISCFGDVHMYFSAKSVEIQATKDLFTEEKITFCDQILGLPLDSKIDSNYEEKMTLKKSEKIHSPISRDLKYIGNKILFQR
ncbi:hypothetical protein ACTFIU_009248 [Dictyostelium citrinum]